MSKLEEETSKLIIYKNISSTTGRISDRARRKLEKSSQEIYNLLKRRKGTELHTPEILIRLSWSDEASNWARNISLALEELKQEDPEAYKRVEEKIKKHRSTRRAYLEFEGKAIEELYIVIIQELLQCPSYEEAREIYRALLKMEEFLGKKEGLQKVLLPE
ncbi:MAG: hypothetical protein KatS3mg001_179 [Candidatus Pacearchaeota archaeon]|nr:MAG: hypothetical protein KatS3mg001_179 [Candidatus Pacearchaeota archaeon]